MPNVMDALPNIGGALCSASRLQHASDLLLKFALSHTICGSMEVWQTSSLRRLRLGEEKYRKIERRKKKPQGKNIMSASATQGGHNKHKHTVS